MEITVIKKKKPGQSTKENPVTTNGRIGFWGQVCNCDSKTMTVDVIANTGFKYIGIPVLSRTWVVKKDNYVAADRFLPPVNSRVFVLMPTHTISGAFVLCSGIPAGDSEYHDLYAQNSSEVDKKNNLYETVNECGWDIKKYTDNGNTILESLDGNIKIQINPNADSGESLNKEIHITAWNNNIILNNSGIEITDKNNISIKTSSTSIVIQGKQGKLEIL